MKHLIILTILLTLNTSFMSKNDKFIIYRKDTPSLIVMSIDFRGNPQFTTNEDMGMRFDNEQLAQSMIESFNEPISFFGTRPIRR